MSTTPNDPTPTYAATAADLRRMADALEQLGHRPDLDGLWVSIGVQPLNDGVRHDRGDALTVRTVDHVGAALFGSTGSPTRVSGLAPIENDRHHYTATGRVGELRVSVYGPVHQ